MNKKVLKSLLGAGVLVLSSAASATVIDFASLADNPPPGETGAQPLNLGQYLPQLGGVSLYAYGHYYGTDTTAQNNAEAYLDSGGAGLGVCHTSGGCWGSSDDNIGQYEVLELDFGSVATINALTLRNSVHQTDFTGQYAGSFSVSTDGANWVPYTLAGSVNIAPLVGTKFYFKEASWNIPDNGNNSPQFYVNTISAAVPEPGSLALMGLGLLGLALAAKRRLPKSHV